MDSRGKRLVALALARLKLQKPPHNQGVSTNEEQLQSDDDTCSSDSDVEDPTFVPETDSDDSDGGVKHRRRIIIQETEQESTSNIQEPTAVIAADVNNATASTSTPNAEGDNVIVGTDHNTTVDTELMAEQGTMQVNQEPIVHATPSGSGLPSSSGKQPRIRRKIAAHDEWKQNKRKHLRNSGAEYTTAKGKRVPNRQLKAVDCSKCKMKCNEKISEPKRKTIFDDYWNTKSYNRQRDYLCQCIRTLDVARRRKENQNKRNRNATLQYWLPIDGRKERVCKKFFLGTLDVGERTVFYTINKRSDSNIGQADKRGQNEPPNKTAAEASNGVKIHIESFPQTESHYCRASSKKKYLATDLNVTKMYHLYREQRHITNPVSLAVYRKIFHTDYNLSFHKPKKDQCTTCTRYKNLPEQEKLQFGDTYKAHQERKTKAREEKNNDKERGKTDSAFESYTYDLQAVLYSPCAQTATLYYTRKLCTYNLTIYNQNTHAGFCYLWSEVEGKRGSNEIGSCLFKYLEGISADVQEISLFSDCCGGQNRNRYVTSILLHAVQVTELRKIDQKFLEPGHTQMEADSMHSTIECARKTKEIYSPSDWAAVIRSSRKSNPYKLTQLNHRDILDLKHLQKAKYPNMNTNLQGENVAWMEIKWIQFRKESPGSFYYKTGFDQKEFKEVKAGIEETPAPRRRGRPPAQAVAATDFLKQAHTGQIPITVAKKNDLVKLCKAFTIPVEYHPYYHALPTSTTARDTLPEPDIDE